jgi:GntR family transcriptional regulator, transcriptional repressor for pyruvate dehydrogenase complex
MLANKGRNPESLNTSDTHKVAKLGPIYVPKSSEILASQLRAYILNGTIADGATLPAERDLVTETGLSRGSVREALRILQTEGLVTTRTGRSGGSIARRPSDDVLVRHIGLFVKGRAIPLISLLQVRESFEPAIAALAALNRTEADVAALIAITERLEQMAADVPAFLAENVNWHVAVAAASQNDLLKAFTTAISGLVFKASAIDNFASEDLTRLSAQAQRRILDAIVERDAEAARRRTTRHTLAITQHMRAFESASLILP